MGGVWWVGNWLTVFFHAPLVGSVGCASVVGLAWWYLWLAWSGGVDGLLVFPLVWWGGIGGGGGRGGLLSGVGLLSVSCVGHFICWVRQRLVLVWWGGTGGGGGRGSFHCVVCQLSVLCLVFLKLLVSSVSMRGVVCW